MNQLNIQNQWWRKIKEDGDLSSFSNLHSYFYPFLVEFAFTYIKEQEISEEVVDDVFINLWEKREKLENIRNIKSFLYTCTRNKALDYLRKINQEPQFDNELFKLESIKCDSESHHEVEMDEFLSLLQDAIEKLPSQCKMIFRMHLNDNLKNSEIAEIMGLAKKTVEAQIYIAYKKLTSNLKKIYA